MPDNRNQEGKESFPARGARPGSSHAFWPYYLMAHWNPRCRALHFVGSTGALIAIFLAFALKNAFWLPAGLIFAYAMAWVGHFAIERNRPATFGNPLWSLAGDIRMYLLWLTGGLSQALAAAEATIGQTTGESTPMGAETAGS